MVAIETQAVNVLTKMDLLSERNKQLVEHFLDTDTRNIIDTDSTHIWNERHRKLTKCIAQVYRNSLQLHMFLIIGARRLFHREICTVEQ